MPESEININNTDKQTGEKAVKRRVPKRRKKMNPFTQFLSGAIPWEGDSVGEAVRKIVLLTATIALFITGFMLLNFYVLRENANNQDAQYWADEKERNSSDDVMTLLIHDNSDENNENESSTKEVTILAEYADYYEQNHDYVGWISMYPYIQYPVVQYSDNDYYLKHSFSGDYSENGTIFADYQGKITADSMPGNLLLYGHNLITNNFFQPLSHFRKEGMEFLKNNYMLQFDTLYNRNRYFIFAVFLTNTKEEHGEVFKYWDKVNFGTKSEFDNYIAECLDRSYFYTGVDLEYGDEIITLSTCDFSMFNDMRLVVMGRKVRDDEGLSLDTSTFIDNTGFDDDGNIKRKMFDAYYKLYGCEWAGRQWDRSYIKDFREE